MRDRLFTVVGVLGLTGLGLVLSGCESSSTTTQPSQATEVDEVRAGIDTASVPTSQFDKPGYATYLRDGRLWVFEANTEAQVEFLKTGEPAKNVTWVGEGPRGMTIKSDSADTLLAYIAAKPGYRTFVEDGRVWVFEVGSAGLSEYMKMGEPAKNVTWIGEGPRGTTLRSDSTDTLLSYLAAKPGFYTTIEDGRIWVFESGSESLAEYKKMGEPAKNVTWIGEGPRGATIKSDSSETLLAYVASVPGFKVYPEDGRLWVFREGSEAHQQFLTVGEPAKNVTLVGEGPRGVTVRAADRSVALAYLAAVSG